MSGQVLPRDMCPRVGCCRQAQDRLGPEPLPFTFSGLVRSSRDRNNSLARKFWPSLYKVDYASELGQAQGQQGSPEPASGWTWPWAQCLLDCLQPLRNCFLVTCSCPHSKEHAGRSRCVSTRGGGCRLLPGVSTPS